MNSSLNREGKQVMTTGEEVWCLLLGGNIDINS